MAEGEGFEPPIGRNPITVFKTAAFNRSANPPGGSFTHGPGRVVSVSEYTGLRLPMSTSTVHGSRRCDHRSGGAGSGCFAGRFHSGHQFLRQRLHRLVIWAFNHHPHERFGAAGRSEEHTSELQSRG